MIYYLENSAKEDIGRTYPQLEFYKKGEDKKFNYFESVAKFLRKKNFNFLSMKGIAFMQKDKKQCLVY